MVSFTSRVKVTGLHIQLCVFVMASLLIALTPMIEAIRFWRRGFAKKGLPY